VKNIQHIIRLVVILVVVGVVLIAVRSALVPPTFGQYGSYVGASVEAIRNEPTRYAGNEACKSCHKKEWGKWERKEHRSVSCEVCHGPSAAHSVENIEPRPTPHRCKSNGKMVDQAHDLCMSCHAKAPGRLGDFPQITAMVHLSEFKITEESPDFEESMRCLNCHPGHSPIK
jgi:hypothetical protein